MSLLLLFKRSNQSNAIALGLTVTSTPFTAKAVNTYNQRSVTATGKAGAFTVGTHLQNVVTSTGSPGPSTITQKIKGTISVLPTINNAITKSLGQVVSTAVGAWNGFISGTRTLTLKCLSYVSTAFRETLPAIITVEDGHGHAEYTSGYGVVWSPATATITDTSPWTAYGSGGYITINSSGVVTANTTNITSLGNLVSGTYNGIYYNITSNHFIAIGNARISSVNGAPGSNWLSQSNTGGNWTRCSFNGSNWVIIDDLGRVAVITSSGSLSTTYGAGTATTTTGRSTDTMESLVSNGGSGVNTLVGTCLGAIYANHTSSTSLNLVQAGSYYNQCLWDGFYFVCLADTTTGPIAYSSNTTTWTTAAIPSSGTYPWKYLYYTPANVGAFVYNYHFGYQVLVNTTGKLLGWIYGVIIKLQANPVTVNTSKVALLNSKVLVNNTPTIIKIVNTTIKVIQTATLNAAKSFIQGMMNRLSVSSSDIRKLTTTSNATASMVLVHTSKAALLTRTIVVTNTPTHTAIISKLLNVVSNSLGLITKTIADKAKQVLVSSNESIQHTISSFINLLVTFYGVFSRTYLLNLALQVSGMALSLKQAITQVPMTVLSSATTTISYGLRYIRSFALSVSGSPAMSSIISKTLSTTSTISGFFSKTYTLVLELLSNAAITSEKHDITKAPIYTTSSVTMSINNAISKGIDLVLVFSQTAISKTALPVWNTIRSTALSLKHDIINAIQLLVSPIITLGKAITTTWDTLYSVVATSITKVTFTRVLVIIVETVTEHIGVIIHGWILRIRNIYLNMFSPGDGKEHIVSLYQDVTGVGVSNTAHQTIDNPPNEQVIPDYKYAKSVNTAVEYKRPNTKSYTAIITSK